MATGLSNQLTGQIGEYIVCAELGRLDILWKGTKKYFKAKQIVELHRELHSR